MGTGEEAGVEDGGGGGIKWGGGGRSKGTEW